MAGETGVLQCLEPPPHPSYQRPQHKLGFSQVCRGLGVGLGDGFAAHCLSCTLSSL